MWPLKTPLIFALLIVNSISYAGDLTLKEAKIIAGKHFQKESPSKNKLRLTYDVPASFLKKSYLIQVNYLGIMDVPGSLIAVGPDKLPQKITTNADLKTFLKEMNTFVKQESLDIKSPDEAQKLLKTLVNIYGIYDSEISCKGLMNPVKYKCIISKTSPRKSDGEIMMDRYGVTLKQD